MNALSPARPAARHLRNAVLLAAVWGLIGLFYFSQSLVQMRLGHDTTPWWHPLVSWMVGVAIAALGTPAILALGHRVPFRRRAWLVPAIVHLGSSITYGLASLALESMILPRFHVYPNIMKDTISTFVFLMVIGFHQAVITYWTILALQAGWDAYQRDLARRREAVRLELRASQLQSQLAHAQLEALKGQLQPHFLFNTLNAIMTLVRQGRGADAELMLGRLADLLRGVLDDMNAQEIPLRRELEYLTLYLSIEEVRFADRLRVEVSADPGLLDAMVPHLGLQPLVENAIRHGFARSASASRISIRARREREQLVLSVEDDGPGLASDGRSAPPGIGLANTRARLARLYGENARLSIADASPHGVVATIELPYHASATMPVGEEAAYGFDRPDR